MTHKYGIEIPRDVEHAHEIDLRNGNTMWRGALKKDMYNVRVAFEILDEGAHGWKQVTRHLVWDVKMDFTTKTGTNRINLCWCGVKGECAYSPNLCSIE